MAPVRCATHAPTPGVRRSGRESLAECRGAGRDFAHRRGTTTQPTGGALVRWSARTIEAGRRDASSQIPGCATSEAGRTVAPARCGARRDRNWQSAQSSGCTARQARPVWSSTCTTAAPPDRDASSASAIATSAGTAICTMASAARSTRRVREIRRIGNQCNTIRVVAVLRSHSGSAAPARGRPGMFIRGGPR
jgi:hypothetical protein